VPGAALAVLLCAAPPAVAAARGSGDATRVREGTYSATGVIKSFGPDRAFVRIAHDTIPGFMEAMTMPFRARAAEQLAGLSVGDAVRFRFAVQTDGACVLEAIEKR
jgi:protein SCO1/2